MYRHILVSMLLCLLASPLLAADPKPAADNVLFDFETPADLKGWSNLTLPDAKMKEPAAKWELSNEHATSGKSSLKITFTGGNWPAILSKEVPDDWMPWETFLADVTVERTCVVGFCVMQEKSTRGTGWDGGVSRWTKTAFLQPGKNTISASLHPNEWSSIRTKLENGKELGKVVSLEIFMYRPRDGESIFVDNIRLTATKERAPVATKTEFKVLGTDLVVSGVQELSKKLADKWTEPKAQTVEQVETSFRTQYDELKKEHPKAILAILRDGEQGYDPADPKKVYAGWKDAYWSSHGPDGLTVERSTTYGKSETQEIFMRHRSPLMRVELSSIPKGSTILAARLLVVRAAENSKEHTPLKPNMWVAEACNRPWEENEVNAYRNAGDKFWKAIGGMAWGEDPDFLPIYLAHGASQPGCSTWDFTHAVRFWTDGKHENHGFMLHGDSKDWFRAWFREAPKVKDRPAVLVIYEPK